MTIKAHRLSATEWVLIDPCGDEASAKTQGEENLVEQLTNEARFFWDEPEIVITEPTSYGFCGTCAHSDGVDEATDTCKCRLNDPHRDWRYNNNEPCPKWAICACQLY